MFRIDIIVRPKHMMSYFQACENIINNLSSVLDRYSFKNAILAGGGYGYESIKYTNTFNLNLCDLDLICVVESSANILEIINSPFLSAHLSFGKQIHFADFVQDVELFNTKLVSMIRLSGKVNGLKTGINFTTFERLQEIFSSDIQQPLFKIAHTPTYQIINAVGNNGAIIIVAMHSPEVSSLYESGKHQLIVDYSWYKNSEDIYYGLFTDFIAKGKVVRDTTDRRLLSVQNKILHLMVRNADSKIRETGSWELMFASNQYFAGSFKKDLRERMGGIAQSRIVEKPAYSLKKSFSTHKNILSVFPNEGAKYFYQAHYLSKPTKDFTSSISANSGPALNAVIHEIASQEEQILKLLNAEIIRLSTLISLSTTKQPSNIPEKMTLANLTFHEGSLYYLSDNLRRTHIPQFLLEETYEDYTQFESTDTVALTLILLLTQLRIDTVHFMLTINGYDQGAFIDSCIVSEEFKGTFKKRQSWANSI